MENSLVKHKWVRIMCDYTADPVWDKDGVGCGLEDLPVDPFIRRMLAQWQDIYEMFDGKVAPTHSEMGEAIAKFVKRQLPDWTVVYFHAHKVKEYYRQPEDGRDQQDRSYFEYEVQLESLDEPALS